MRGESTRERRERLDAITARITLRQQTIEDVEWLREIADEYIASWERTIGQLRRRAEKARSTAWPAADSDARRPRRPTPRGGAR